jgi:predicted DNA-binding protein
MADGELTVKVDAETAQRLEALAEAAGQSVAEYVRDLIVDSLPEDDWAEDIAALEEYDRTGVSYSVEEGMAVFDAAMKAHLEKPR